MIMRIFYYELNILNVIIKAEKKMYKVVISLFQCSLFYSACSDPIVQHPYLI